MTEDSKILARLVKRAQARPSDPLGPLLDEYYLRRRKSKRRLRRYVIDMQERPRPLGRLSPSSIGGCERQAALKFLGVESRAHIDPDREAIFEHGNWIHHKRQAMFLDMEKVLGKRTFQVYSTEAAIEVPKLFIAGTLDNEVLINGRRWIIDIKSINDYGYNYVTASDEPSLAYIWQLHVYMKARGVRRGMLDFENKNNQHSRRFVVNYDPAQWVEIRQWCRSVLRQIHRQELPAMHPDCTLGSFMADKCSFAYLCYGRHSERAIRTKAYQDFTSLNDLWERGWRELARAA